jgi:hypothetical protein
MKTNKMLSGLLFFIITATFPYASEAQESSPKNQMVYPTIGVGIGFFYPEDVNNYIKDVVTAGYSTVNTELYMYLEVKGGLTFRLKNVDFTAALEYDIAPKFVVVDAGDNISYSYTRLAPEISANYFIPNKSGKNAFFIGGGISYSFMKFKDFSASNPGFKIQTGYSMQFSKINIQPYFAFRYVKASDSSIIEYQEGKNSFDLSYTGGQIGVLISFHPRMLYK